MTNVDVAGKGGAPRTMRWRTAIGLGLSLAIHALLLVSIHRDTEVTGVENEKQRAPLIVELGPPQPAAPSAPAAPVQPQVAPAPPVPAPVPPKPRSVPRARVTQAPRATQSAPTAAPPTDMSAMVAAARARRAAAGIVPPEDPAPAQPESRTAAGGARGNEIALENIERSVKQGRGREGTSGLFRILHKGPRSASFSFRGWSTDSNKHWNQIIEVDAGPGGDVEHAIVRKMIELIRQHHQEDFYWESQRLGRIVKLSARRGDSAGLEDFLMLEFFGNG